jgi:hypothetical protein
MADFEDFENVLGDIKQLLSTISKEPEISGCSGKGDFEFDGKEYTIEFHIEKNETDEMSRRMAEVGELLQKAILKGLNEDFEKSSHHIDRLLKEPHSPFDEFCDLSEREDFDE